MTGSSDAVSALSKDQRKANSSVFKIIGKTLHGALPQTVEE